ncbi:MAG TPA: TusE/DsrC/DsvC family sulfur relay protein [Balneolaceae bacterium]|nr:TusE/DsrC/DsvC family sulfur relay protein [Balneolaceae bacterium]
METLKLLNKTLELDADGHLAHQSDWSEDLAPELAKQEGIPELTDRHWKVINFMREYFLQKGEAPSIRKLTKESGVPIKELYELFPKGPAKKAAKIAGLPKPKGCI